MQLTGNALALTGYVLATPFVVYPPLFKKMWNGRRHDLFALQETGVALIVAGWALRGDRPAAYGNAAYGVLLAVAYAAWAGRRGDV